MADVTFQVHYATQWGESLYLERIRRELDLASDAPEQMPMNHAGEGLWHVTLSDVDPAEPLQYRYRCRAEGGDERAESSFRTVDVAGASTLLLDQWLATEGGEAAFLRQAFAGVIFQPAAEAREPYPRSKGPVLRLTLRAPRIAPNLQICVSGDHPLLGRWNPARALVMSGFRYPTWEVELALSAINRPIEFKFGLWDRQAGRLVEFEAGPNRVLAVPPPNHSCVVMQAEGFRYPTVWKGAGVAVPVFALRSERGYGIGEFADLAPFASWAAECGLRLIQVLPINDTTSDFTWKDSYPYKAVSSAALHPIYLSIEDLFAGYRHPLPAGYAERKEILNALPELDYEAVLGDKTNYLRQLYAAVGMKTLRDRQFKAFWRSEIAWLKPYCAFCHLRDRHRTADFSRWGEHAGYAEGKIQAWFRDKAPEYPEVMFHAFVQYHLRQQLDAALAAGHERGVAFKGDLPIGIDRCSVEAWTEPQLFHLDRQTGAPPDTFSVLGQNWGFPTYHWPRMAVDGYGWWRQRCEQMATCFDALRIDHILGFFRMWEIPMAQREGLLGHFNPALSLSREDILRAGFRRDPAQFCVPAVAESDLREFFPDDVADTARQALTRDQDGWLRPRTDLPGVGTGSQDANNPDQAERIAKGLERLGYEVLFREDPDQPGRFHPRINLAQTRRFQALSAEEQAALRDLHDDFFFRRHNRFWEEMAMLRLPVLMDATSMLICGEDLGMIPDSVPIVLRRLGVLSLEIQRLPKQSGVRFADPQQYPYLSVCTTSTHDMPTLRGWWAEDESGRREFHRQVMGRSGEPPSDCTTEIGEFIVSQHLTSTSMWCVLPLQDWLALDPQLRRPNAAEERINVPANARHYWRYRMHLTIERLREAQDFNHRLAQQIESAGRRPRV